MPTATYHHMFFFLTKKRKQRLKALFLTAFCCFFVHLFFTPVPLNAKQLFPLYPEIQANVAFWEKIYSTYSINTAVIHDNRNLKIIYTTLSLKNRNLPGAKKFNNLRIAQAKKKYTAILKRFAQGKKPQNSEEKRVRNFFKKNTGKKEFQQAVKNIRFQTGMKERFIEGVIQSGKYMKEIKAIFRQAGLPEDLAYLPHVESSFNLKAYSKFGAAGIWQFTRSTGQSYLTINYEVDERMDPLFSAKAAASFLKNSYKDLNNWPMAITSYNYGKAGMMRAKQAFTSYPKIFTHYSQGHFKFASRNFYSEFLAAVFVAKQFEQSMQNRLSKPEQTILLTMPSYISVDNICNYFSIDESTLKRLNPSLRNPVWQRSKYIPKRFKLRFPERIDRKLFVHMPSSIFSAKQKPSKYYKVKKGDTALKIALTHNISLKRLIADNNLSKNGAIYAGQSLKLPVKITNRAAYASSHIVRLKSDKTKKVKVTRTATKKKIIQKKKIPLPPSPPAGYYVGNISHHSNSIRGEILIQPGESAPLISKWAGSSVKTLQQLNNSMELSRLQPGQKFALEFTNISIADFEEKRQNYHMETEEDFFAIYHVAKVQQYKVKTGDTLWIICRDKFDIPLWLLKKYNARINFLQLTRDQTLSIPIVEKI